MQKQPFRFMGFALRGVACAGALWAANVAALDGTGYSGLVKIDTRYGLGTGLNISGYLTVDTRIGGSAGVGGSDLFAVNTLGGAAGSATLSGRVTDNLGAPLAFAVVSLLEGSLERARTTTDGAGNYTLSDLPAGEFSAQASKFSYLLQFAHGLALAPGETTTRDFQLAIRPGPPLLEPGPMTPNLPGALPSDSQLKVYSAGSFQAGGLVDADKATVVLTHGWNSSPSVWAEAMAAALTGLGDHMNILAWDWPGARTGGNVIGDLAKAWQRTPGEGERLGKALEQTLGGSYNLPIHFVGHSLGSLVNAGAVDYLVFKVDLKFRKLAHVTVLDDGAGAYKSGNLISLLNLEMPNYILPVPSLSAWIDNYVSLFGSFYLNAVNVLLVQGPDRANTSSIAVLVQDVHRYAADWYRKTVVNPSQSPLGFRWAQESRPYSSSPYPSPSPYPLGSILAQSRAGAELGLQRIYTFEELVDAFEEFDGIPELVAQRGGVIVKDGARRVGSAIVDYATSLFDEPAGDPVYSGTAGSTPMFYSDTPAETTPYWSPSVRMEVGPYTGSPAPPPGGPTTNEQAAVWLPIEVPPDADLFAFTFSFAGDPAEDVFVADIGSSNVFRLDARFLPTNSLLNSGPIDVSEWAGQTVDFFFGLLGGTSAEAQMTVDGMRFYTLGSPALSARREGGGIALEWSAGASGHQLEASQDLANSDGWQAVPRTPVLSGLSLVVTNEMGETREFYRLNSP